MSEFDFSKERADRWGNSMKALWSSLEICPPTDRIDLPHHIVEELHSIGHLKVWGDTHKPHPGMVYLLVWVDNTSEVRNYGMDIVWTGSHQARLGSMGEALESISSLTSEGSDWPYVLIQLYEGANHMPLPKDRHVCVLPLGKMGSPSGQISQLKIHWLLSDGPLVVFPKELNEGDQSVTISLAESLHSGSSITTDENPYIQINIPTLILEEQSHANLPLGEKQDSASSDQYKVPWKPKITLIGEITDLIDRGMMDNYDQELEHPIVTEVPSTKADTLPPLKREKPVLLLDTHSQTSMAEMEASGESNPAGASPMAVAHSSLSSSPIAHISELQSDIHLAVNSMFTAKRTLDFEMQQAIWDFKASLCQKEVEAATTNEKAKTAHSRRDLKARVRVCQGHDEGQIQLLYGHSRGQGRVMHRAGRIKSHLLRSHK